MRSAGAKTDSGGRSGWLLLGTALFAAAATVGDPITSATLAMLGSLSVGIQVFTNRRLAAHPVVLAGLLGIALVFIANTQPMGRFSIYSGSYSIWLALSLGTAVLAVASGWMQIRTVAVSAALLTVVTSSLLVLVPDWNPVMSSDVYRAHAAAGRAIANAENPYSDAVVFTSGDPFKPADTRIVGYPYPPPALSTYGATAILTDSRLVSLLAWFGLTGWMAALSLRTGLRGEIALGVLVLMAVMPIWRLSLFMGWTEPLSLVLFAISGAAIVRKRRWGWVLLGVAIASKQYFLVVAPLTLLYVDDSGRRPGWISLLAAGGVTALPAILGPDDYVRAVVSNALDIGFRPDTQSLNGLIQQLGSDFLIPMPVALAIVALVTILVVGISDQDKLWSAGALVLAVTFLTNSAFPNYWLMVAGLAGLAAVFCPPDRQGGRLADPAGDGAVGLETRRGQVADEI